MRRQPVCVAILVLLIASQSSAQVDTATSSAGVPPVIRFSGTLPVPPGRVAVTLGLYTHQLGGEPLWEETQAVAIDAAGRYAVVLGTTTALPSELFVSGEARWLDVTVEGLGPRPRALLVSVPYAIKAGDAETIGGRPLSAFVLAGDRTGVGADGLAYVDTRVLASGLAATGSGPAPGGAGTANFIGMFTDATTLGNSAIYQTPGGYLGMNTTAPQAAFHAVSWAAPVAYFDVFSNALTALPVVYRAARGTVAAPAAVQTNDILGGLAVRGYGATTWSTGRGQVMYKAAENWTDAAQGTYLQFTTTPIGTGTWAERMRIAPDGKVGIGTPAPGQMLSVAGTIESTTGGFLFPDGTAQTTAARAVTGNNIAFGPGSLGSLTSGTSNTAFGYQALSANTEGGANTATGYRALGANTIGVHNTASGYGALQFNTSGAENTATGTGALILNTTGSQNSAYGVAALRSNTTGYQNTASGVSALYENTTGYQNTAAGQDALHDNTTGSINAAFGSNALSANTTGFNNTAIGYAALASNTIASGNTATGSRALQFNTDGTQNTAGGYAALAANTTGRSNTATGYQALTANTTASGNTATGYQALAANTTGDRNTATGYLALAANTTGVSNSAIGNGALESNTTGYGNTASGWLALRDNTTGIFNTASGYTALYQNTTGSNNTVIGNAALAVNTIGSENTALGTAALIYVTGDNNIGIGNYAGRNLTTGSDNIVIGHPGVAAENSTIRIGTSGTHTRTFIAGIRGVTTGSANAIPVLIDSNGQLGTASSSRRVKDDIADMAGTSSGLMNLRPVTFHYKSDRNPSGRTLQYGLIAEEVAAVYPGLVAHSADGQIETVMYQFLPPMLLNEYQKQQRTIDELRAQVAALTQAVEALRDRKQ